MPEITPDPLAELQRVIDDGNDRLILQHALQIGDAIAAVPQKFNYDMTRLAEQLNDAANSDSLTYAPELVRHNARIALEQYITSWKFWLAHLPQRGA